MSYLRQIPAMFSVDLTEFEADVPVLLSGNEKGLNVTELKEACENDKYSVTLLVDVTGESQNKLYFTKVAYSEENGGYFFAGGNDDINGLMIEFAETVTGMHMILLGFKGESGGVAVMTREEWNAVEKKNDYGLVAVLDYNDRYIAGTLYNGEYFVENLIASFYIENQNLKSNTPVNIVRTPTNLGIDEHGEYFIPGNLNGISFGLIESPSIEDKKIVIKGKSYISPQNTGIVFSFGGSNSKGGIITLSYGYFSSYANGSLYTHQLSLNGLYNFRIEISLENVALYIDDELIYTSEKSNYNNIKSYIEALSYIVVGFNQSNAPEFKTAKIYEIDYLITN